MNKRIGKRGRDFDRLDPTDYDGLPSDCWDVEIDYVRSTLPRKQQNSYTLRLFFKASILGALASFVVLILGPLLGGTDVLPFLLCLGQLFAMMIALGDRENLHELREYLAIPVAVAVGWAVLFVSQQGQYAIIFLAFILALVVGRECVVHFATVRTGIPAPVALREELRKFAHGKLLWLQLLAIPLVAFALGPNVTLFFEQTSLSLWAQPLTACLFALFLLAWPCLFGLLKGQTVSISDMFVGTWGAIRSFSTFGRFPTTHDTERYESAPLTLSSPTGLFRFRTWSIFVAVIAVAVTLLPFCDYFPTSKVPPASLDFYALLSIKPPYDPTIPELNADEQAKIHRLRMAPYFASRAELVAKLEQWGKENPNEILPRLIPVNSYPGNWILHSLFNTRDSTASLYNVSFSLAAAAVIPGLFFYLLCFAVGANYNATIYAMTREFFSEHEGSNPTPDSRITENSGTAANKNRTANAANRWDSIVKELQNNPQTEEYIYVGKRVDDDRPEFVHINHFKEHCHYLGGSGSGKTALGLAPLISQLIRMGNCNVVIFDLKNDPTDRSFFENARIEAEAAGHDFKFFSTSPLEPTHLCNPFLETELSPPGDLEQRASTLCEALGLLHGEKYGESYYTEANIRVARSMLAKIVTEDGYYLKEPITFHRLKKLINEVKAETSKRDQKIIEDANHLESVVEKYSYIPVINYIPEQTDASLLRGSIKFDDLYTKENLQVYFFGLNAENDPVRTGGLTRLFLNRLMKSQSPPGTKRRQTYVIVDEFQMAAAPQFTRLLEQARSSKIGLVLANQSIPRIKELGGESLEAALFDSVRYRQVFQVEAIQELERFEKLAGRYSRESLSERVDYEIYSGLATGFSRATSEVQDLRFDITDWRVMNANKHQSVMFATKNIGFTRTNGLPVLISSDYHISFDEMERRASQDPPEVSPERTTGMQFRAVSESQSKKPSKKTSSQKVPRRFHIGNEDAED